MNPWAVLVILLGIVLVIVGIKGTQHNVTSAITGKQHQGTGSPVASGPPGTAKNPTGTPAPHQPGTPNPQPNPAPTSA